MVATQGSMLLFNVDSVVCAWVVLTNEAFNYQNHRISIPLGSFRFISRNGRMRRGTLLLIWPYKICISTEYNGMDNIWWILSALMDGPGTCLTWWMSISNNINSHNLIVPGWSRRCTKGEESWTEISSLSTHHRIHSLGDNNNLSPQSVFSKLSCSIRGVGDPPIKYQLSASVVSITWDKKERNSGSLCGLVDGYIDGWSLRPAFPTVLLPHNV